jgi:RNA polymerase sigma factor (TIGR02999 family)
MDIVYDELHRLARGYMRGERPGHMLGASALVDEAFIRLVDHVNINWQNRRHFYAVAAQAMRRVLVDYARIRLYEKRSGRYQHTDLDEEKIPADGRTDEERATNIIAVHEALFKLEKIDELKCRVVELQFFLGLTQKEVAERLAISEATVERKWRGAKAWLNKELACADRQRDPLSSLADDGINSIFPP